MALATMRIAGEDTRALPQKVTLTKTIIEGLKCPANQRARVVYDAKVNGLCIHVSKQRKGFYMYRKVAGRPVRYKLGSYPDLSIENARIKAHKHVGQIVDGKDPREEQKAIRDSITLGELFTRWQDDYAKLQHTTKTLATDQSRFDTCFAEWKSRKTGTIKTQHVQTMHTKLAKDRGKTTANRAIQLLRRLFYWAKIEPNPAGKKSVRFFREEERERFLLPGELPKFFESLDQEPSSTLRDYFYASLFTGQRRNNVCTMEWDEVDEQSATWTIPGSKTKNHKPQQVHLAPPMLALLARRKAEAERKAAEQDERYTKGFVFPSYRRDAKHPHLTEPKGAWKRLLDRAGLKDLRIHDLRRSLGSWATMTGANQQTVGKALGHLDQNSTAIYARLNLDPVRVSVDLALVAMQAAGSDENTKKVVGSLIDEAGVVSEPMEIAIHSKGKDKTWVAKMRVPSTYKGSGEGIRLVLPNGLRVTVTGAVSAGANVELQGNESLV